MWKRIISVIGATLAVCIALPATAEAASEYDDLVEKVTTKTLINYVDNYHGKTCGSPTDDYAKKWLHQFKRQKHNDREDHPAAVASLMRAITSEKGAYAVIYEQHNAHDKSSIPYFLTVFWTEDGRDNLTMKFRRNGGNREVYLSRKPNTYNKVYVAVVASPMLIQGRNSYCEPEFLWGFSGDYSSWPQATENTHRKLFTSTFKVEYPEGYQGAQLPDRKEALSWKPTSSPYDDLVENVTEKRLVNYVRNYYGRSCGSPYVDYKDRWFNLFKYPEHNKERPYHPIMVDSLERAMAHGDYAITYVQQNTYNNKTKPYMLAIFWSEKKGDFYLDFMNEAPQRQLAAVRTKGTSGTLHAALIGSPMLIQGRNSICEPEFLWGNYYWNYGRGATPPFQMVEPVHTKYIDPMKIYKSTFKVKYPEVYRGMRVPGNPTKLDYLALGDSFSSGEGDTDKNPATDRKYYRQWTDVNEDKAKGAPREKCHVSTRSYPYKLANWMGLGSGPSAAWASVACSGATVYDINWDNSGGYEGQDSPLGRLHGYDNKGVLQKMALNEMIPGRVKQIEFVKKYQPKVITLTAGGNDVGFGKKLVSCVGPESTLGDCVYAKTEMRNRIKSEILEQFDRLKSLYEELKTATNNKTKIYVLGYPQFINGAPDAPCFGRGLLSLSAREREMITNSITYLNNTIKQAAKAAGVKYVDIENAFGDHWLCGNSDRHVNPFLLNEMIVSRIPDFRLPWVEFQESFHPNAKGHADIARAFRKELGGVNPADYKICKNDATTCPDNSATKDNIPTPPYFNVANEQEDVKFTYYKLSNGTATKVQEKYIEIKTSRRPYKPWKKVYVKIYSEPRDLGEIETDKNGEINGSVALPEDLPAGYHTLVVSGEAPDGKKQELYQTILVKGPNPNDIDENGTPDKNQPCGAFTQAANKDEDLDGIDDACDPEITDPILYTARNGKSSLGEDEDRIYLFRNTRAANLTGVTNDYVDKSKNQNNADALVGHTLSEETRGLAFNKLVVMKEDDGDIKKGTPIILAKDVNEKCYVLKPEDYLSPALKPGSKDYKLRGLIKLNKLPKGVSCEKE